MSSAEVKRALRQHLLQPPGPAPLREALHQALFAQWNQDFLTTEDGKRAVDDEVFGRFNQALGCIVPWVASRIDLSQARILEVGCGTGSSTAAFGLFCKEIKGFDIDATSVAAARARSAHFGLNNVQVAACPPAELLSACLAAYERVEVVLCYAVLEHMTIAERLEYLAGLWQRLTPGGLLVVVETPNRFIYVDRHTSDLPFLHMLPDELALRYYRHSKRFAFVEAMDQALAKSPADAVETRVRWGLGVSFHEFELALEDKLEELVIADAWDEDIREMFACQIDEDLLIHFFLAAGLEQPVGFARGVITLILKKPRDEADRAEARAFNAERRKLLRHMFPPYRKLALLRSELDTVYASTSWKLSAPIRWIGRVLGRDRT